MFARHQQLFSYIFAFKFSATFEKNAAFMGCYRDCFSVARKAITSSILGSDMFNAVSIAALGLGCAEFRMVSSAVSMFVKRDSQVILALCPFSWYRVRMCALTVLRLSLNA